jgi:hypothetical protein
MDVMLDRYPLDLIERDCIVGAVVELGRTRTFVGGDALLLLFDDLKRV